ncbi:cytochrome c peroxidase [Hydrogenivirga sp. 128-5-R1-1]|uniref:cytochrome-c peroxidase n=1 Tax=Hydrogenivirga sp. 128-5-R1-1 TaxID=392423 RepID=UPI00015F36BE|nr:cytochrome c peroxidase [Hydrogenivirga sp. 128-5-R1-1]EDP76388.1 Di-haem cytochrome c peroxidase [Hydrogenivirga sp. 128-5-R1-1]
MRRKAVFFSFLLFFLLLSCGGGSSLDTDLSAIIKKHNLKPIEKPKTDPDTVALGRALFFDKIVSGNKDISCATCHDPRFGTGDCLPLPVGTKGSGECLSRKRDAGRPFIPRNAPEVFNRGHKDWKTMFWDARVELKNGQLRTPAGSQLPQGLENVLQAQAIFPITSRDEMRGRKGDIASDGSVNDLALIDDDQYAQIWQAVMNRVLSIPEYRDMFKKAFGDRNYTIVDFGKAIAEFETEAFTLTDSPWDRYLRGDKGALSYEAKRGALLFYGKAKCYTCHSGTLFTDQKFHNIGVPQFGPGKNANGLDLGRYNVSGKEEDKFKFRTPPLRNVAVTSPYFHNGAYRDLKKVVLHHLNPEKYLRNYDPTANGLPPELASTLKNDESTINQILSTLDIEPVHLTEEEVDYLIAFLKSLTSPQVYTLHKVIPDRVPSGLPVK